MISVNIILFVHRAYYFKDFSTLSGAAPNGFYMMSRANGNVKTIEFWQSFSIFDLVAAFYYQFIDFYY